MLAYTLGRLLTQQAVIERDAGTADEWGAESTANWQPHATVACRMWWWKESSRGPAREEATAARTIAMSEGGMVFPLGTDITERDRVSQVSDWDPVSGTWVSVVTDGPFRVIAVMPHSGWVEIAWIRESS